MATAIAPYRRFLLALLGGTLALPLLMGVVRRWPASSRTLETVGLFLLFVFLCLMLDRFRFFNRSFGGSVPSLAGEAR